MPGIGDCCLALFRQLDVMCSQNPRCGHLVFIQHVRDLQPIGVRQCEGVLDQGVRLGQIYLDNVGMLFGKRFDGDDLCRDKKGLQEVSFDLLRRSLNFLK